ncbi:MAG TPA: AAA family ATPase [Planctomycetota bacterium]|nr:AAA family ATPase [Planctomycetota bacterium]
MTPETPQPSSAPPRAGTRAELELLLREYAAACKPGSEERARLEAWPEIRVTARQNWVGLMEAFRAGSVVADDAFWKILPHKQTPLARAHGAFLHVSAAFREDPRTRLQSSGFCTEDDFPVLGRGLFDFVLRCDDYPADLWQACESFAALPGGKAFTSGMISPFLNALRPDDFALVNTDVRAVLNHFCNTGLTTALTDYSTANAGVRELLKALMPMLQAEAFKNVRPEDVFEGFCYWLVNQRMHPLSEALGSDPYAPPHEVDVFPTPAPAPEPVEAAAPAASPQAAAPEPVQPPSALFPPPNPPAAPAALAALAAPVAAPVAEPVAAAEEPEALVEIAPEEAAALFAASAASTADRKASEADFRRSIAQHQYEEQLVGRCIEAIDRKGQIVLYGPPGSGKGRLARLLAARLTEGGDGLRAHLAFHAAWTYADFVQRELPDGQRRLGRFATFCRKAVERRGRCVLVIEDLQRARVAEVLGEALVLLEQRGSELLLAGGGSLSIPRNVRLIATVDSSHEETIAADPVLRHRFEFIELEPE